MKAWWKRLTTVQQSLILIPMTIIAAWLLSRLGYLLGFAAGTT